MATYGFNLGQIEGLDSSVQTVTLTIANATESNTYTLTYDALDDYWGFSSDRREIALHLENQYMLFVSDLKETDVGDTYNVTLSTSAVEENFKSAVETVLVDNGLISEPETLFDGTITITAEDAQGVEIPFDKDVSSYPLEKWTVTVNGLEIPYQAVNNAFMLESNNIGYSVGDITGVYTLQVVNIQGENYPPVPGDYQVKITGVSDGEKEKPAALVVNLGDAINDGLNRTTINQILDAVNNHILVIGCYPDGDRKNFFYTLTEAVADNSYRFTFVSMYSSTIKTAYFAGAFNETPLEAKEKEYTLTPNS